MKTMDQSRKNHDEEKQQKGNNKRTHHKSEAERSSSAQEQRRVQPSREAKKKMKKDDHNDDAPNPEPNPRNARQMPPQFKKYIKDRFKGKNITIGEETLVIEKKLSRTDLGIELRISPTLTKDSLQFLTSEEENDLQKRIENGRLLNDMIVPLTEPSLVKFWVYLGRRVRKSANPEINPGTVFYVLSKTWDHVVKHCNLQAGQIVQLWAVRVDGKLWLVLVLESATGFEPKASSSRKLEEGSKK